MVSRDLPHVRPGNQNYSFIGLLIELFTLGIFSVEGGAKAWFELVLVAAALCASGYLLWWQIPLLLSAIILATLAAGMFSVLIPRYIEPAGVEPIKQTTSALQTLSEYNLNQISLLSGSELEQRLEQFRRAQEIFERNPQILEHFSELQSVLTNINQSYSAATQKAENERQAFVYQQELERQRRKAEEDRRQKAAEIRIQQERLRRAAAEEKARQASEQRRAWLTWLQEQRRGENFTGGCPPDYSSGSPRCRPGYPIKVTLHKPDDYYDGIIWKPSDTGYEKYDPVWCYSSVQEAEAERGKYRFRRPKDNKGRLRA